MGRKPSNVYDYYIRLEPENGKGLVRYQCKKCDKQYASNATRLAEHLRMVCVPGFVNNQAKHPRKKSRPASINMPARPPQTSAHSNPDEDEDETEVADDSMAATVASLAVPYAAEPTPALALKRADQQLLRNMLEAENDPPPDLTEVLLRLAKLSTCVIADAMAEFKIHGHLVDVSLVRGYDAPLAMSICGPALTVKMMPTTGAAVAGASYDYMDTAEIGQVVVISAPAGTRKAMFGGLLATASKTRNVAGVVTDGRVRDVQELCTMNFPAFATGTSVLGNTGSTTIAEVNTPILVAGCVVRHNDVIRGDVNGVVVIPAERAEEVAARAEMVEERDNKIIQALHEGEPLQRCLQRFSASREV
ncbi:hypothetical protein PHYSODRAFT_352393 [Phytophthora sojae]|uniref:BED-type domain-containing protein n=1 Tax=Phytophthora sojae (strain P6497) TaxID=1094619 RepID=G5A1V6_PHYSP|nr:hypothetical protein PHYSODRAFT_352393 [Phytophthora sojae]EGZ10904.1 hypothetical protein PHYSODRAFT_352393 [Phytophthora sojae]|eukprot:XP_009533649.1 hypothetical protein PHYSODRAFT_352393 [Phytophthora sojae]